MKKYEYKTLYVASDKDSEDKINKLGSKGWRVLSVSFSDGGNDQTVIMERVIDLTPDSLAEKGENPYRCDKCYVGNLHKARQFNCEDEKCGCPCPKSPPTEVGGWEEEFDREYTKLNGTNSERGGEIIKSLVKKTLSHQLEEFAEGIITETTQQDYYTPKELERFKKFITQSLSKRK